MIYVGGAPVDTTLLMGEYPESSIEREIIKILSESGRQFNFASNEKLQFELKLRREIVRAASALNKSRMAFRTFRDSTRNPDFWDRTPNGGFALKAGVKPYDAINDIFVNGAKYGTECATAMLMVYYKALAEIFPADVFNKIFPNIYLMNWNQIDPILREVGTPRKTDVFLPGDRRYFRNPDVDSATPEFQGENVIDMGGGLYYGHGFGIHNAETFIRLLNQYRSADADESAYFLESAARPNFDRLAALYERHVPSAPPGTA